MAQTAIADVWQVQSHWGPAALKVFRDGNARNEGAAPRWLDAMKGTGVAPLFAEAPGMVLLGWLEGPLLGDLSRTGADAAASTVLARLASGLLARRPSDALPFPDLATWLAPLWALEPDLGWTTTDREALAAGKALARHLLATAPPPRLLHGDLHHDNIIETPAGGVAFDPKGLWGDPAYELANAFRNPKGFAGCHAPEVQRARLRIFTGITGLPEERLAGWALVKCLLSSVWARGDRTLVRFNLDVFRTLQTAFADLRLLP